MLTATSGPDVAEPRRPVSVRALSGYAVNEKGVLGAPVVEPGEPTVPALSGPEVRVESPGFDWVFVPQPSARPAVSTAASVGNEAMSVGRADPGECYTPRITDWRLWYGTVMSE